MKVVMIGNGIAGFSAASNLRRLDDRCEITLISAESHPLYSACALPDYVSGDLSRETLFVRSMEEYRCLGISCLFGREARELDPIRKKVMTDDGTLHPFDRLVLATGSQAIVAGDRKKGVFTLKTLKDADDLLSHPGKKVVVIGAGPIGIEAAVALQARGYKVTLLEMMDTVLPLGLDPRGAGKVKQVIEGHGIEVLTGERSKTILGNNTVQGIETGKRQIECDTVLWAVGMRPRTDLAKNAGIAVGERHGIKVNARMETNLPGIYACGDCVESNDVLTGEPYPSLFWHNANRQGSIVARNCAGSPVDYPGSQSILNVDIFGRHVAGFGFTETALLRFKGSRSGMSVIEKEKNGTYSKLIVSDDRLFGAQFINPEFNLGLLWTMMFRKRSVREIMKIIQDETRVAHRPWLRRLKPFFG
jgi:NADH oxidase (H2O2-forming)